MLVAVRGLLTALFVLAGTIVPASGASAQEPTTTTSAPADEATTTTTTSTTVLEESTTTTATTVDTSTTSTSTTSTTSTTTSTSTTSTTVVPADGAGLRISVTEEAELAQDAPTTVGILRAVLGMVEVVDERDGEDRQWTVTVACTDFVTGEGTPAETITCDRVRYASGDAVSVEGGPAVLPGQPPGTEPVDLAVPRVAFGGEGGAGRVRVTWAPTVEVVLPPTAVSGEYRGTITHSVA
jgi:hypothetical protein